MKGFKVSMQRLGKYCQIMRKRNGFRLRDLEKRFGISKSNLSKFENGGNNSATILLLYLNFFANDEDVHKIIYKGASFYDTFEKGDD